MWELEPTRVISPFFGEVPELEGVFVASGLGSSGLTTGPLIGKNLVDLVMNRPGSLYSSDYPVAQYVKKKTNSIKALNILKFMNQLAISLY